MDAVALHDAYVRGDVGAIRRLLGDPTDFPNTRGPVGVGENILEYAIYHSPFEAVAELLELGADPNYGHHSGFPSLIAALSAEGRDDRIALVTLLLDAGADVQQRGVNDWTPLHYAAANRDYEGMELLLGRGADPEAHTRIDDRATPLEEAEILGLTDVVAWLRART